MHPVKTKVFKSGNSLAVRLPKGLELPCGNVSIRREGKSIVIEELPADWPDGFFEDIHITRADFKREPICYEEKSL
jgi:virulence-associated protein VagC